MTKICTRLIPTSEIFSIWNKLLSPGVQYGCKTGGGSMFWHWDLRHQGSTVCSRNPGAHIQTMRAAIRNAKEIVPEVTDSCAKCESDCSPRGMADKITRTSKYTFKASWRIICRLAGSSESGGREWRGQGVQRHGFYYLGKLCQCR